MRVNDEEYLEDKLTKGLPRLAHLRKLIRYYTRRSGAATSAGWAKQDWVFILLLLDLHEALLRSNGNIGRPLITKKITPIKLQVYEAM